MRFEGYLPAYLLSMIEKTYQYGVIGSSYQWQIGKFDVEIRQIGIKCDYEKTYN